MLIEFSPAVLIAVNIAAWAVFHLGLAALATALPLRLFRPDGWICRARRWERGGKIYQKLFAVRRWKGLLPEGANILGTGFKKGRLERRDPDYLREYYLETCRSEICHWTVWLCGWLFFLWNPLWAGWVMVIYATLANFPCIIAQRYNRARLARLCPVMKTLASVW
jgi:glycosyl-4,4'-diaponeurosporenoate acyltransferase